MFGCYIVNGHVDDHQTSGGFTFINHNGCSAVDDFIVTRQLFDIIVDFKILENTESSHFPICLSTEVFLHEEAKPKNNSKNKCSCNIDNTNWICSIREECSI